MAKDKTTRQRLEERFPSDEQGDDIIREAHKLKYKYFYADEWMLDIVRITKEKCLTASEELIEKEIEKRDKLLGEMAEKLKKIDILFSPSIDSPLEQEQEDLLKEAKLLRQSYLDFLKGKEQ